MAKRQFTKGIDLYHHQMKRLATMQATMKDSVRDMQKEGVKDAIELTAGTLTRSQTRGQYARGRLAATSTSTGRKRGRAPMLPINQITRRLRRSMRSRSHSKLGFEVLSAGVPYAQFILSEAGTRKMVGRGMKKEAGKRLKARQKAHVDFFIKKQRSI